MQNLSAIGQVNFEKSWLPVTKILFRKPSRTESPLKMKSILKYRIFKYKGFSNRDITILSMNKTQKYLRY